MSSMKKQFCFLLAVLCILTPPFLGGCADMGAGTDEESYKTYFSKVLAVSEEGLVEREISDFNQDTEHVEVVIPHKEYAYIGFKVSKDYAIKISEVAFFLCTSGAEASLDIEFYVSQEFPTKIQGENGDVYLPDANEDTPINGGGAQVYVPETDSAGEVVTRENERDESVLQNSYYSTTVQAGAEWDSCLLEFGSIQTVESEWYIVIKILNNCYDGSVKEKVELTFNHLMFYFDEAEQK